MNGARSPIVSPRSKTFSHPIRVGLGQQIAFRQWNISKWQVPQLGRCCNRHSGHFSSPADIERASPTSQRFLGQSGKRLSYQSWAELCCTTSKSQKSVQERKFCYYRPWTWDFIFRRITAESCPLQSHLKNFMSQTDIRESHWHGRAYESHSAQCHGAGSRSKRRAGVLLESRHAVGPVPHASSLWSPVGQQICPGRGKRLNVSAFCLPGDNTIIKSVTNYLKYNNLKMPETFFALRLYESRWQSRSRPRAVVCSLWSSRWGWP